MTVILDWIKSLSSLFQISFIHNHDWRRRTTRMILVISHSLTWSIRLNILTLIFDEWKFSLDSVAVHTIHVRIG